MKSYSIARDFTEFPGFRYREHSDGSGEEFREDVLLGFMAAGDPVEIDLGGASGYPSSFLEEAFGGLVRAGYSRDQIRHVIHLLAPATYQHYIDMAWEYVEKEARKQQNAQ